METGTGHLKAAFRGSNILVVGGAGFVGSNLCHTLLGSDPGRITVVDNLLSADISNVPEAEVLEFVLGSITQDCILEGLPKDIDYVFHLATYHGNQSSIANPLADHEHNTLTSLKLFDRLQNFPKLRKVVYASAGCTVADKTFEDAQATTEEAPVSLYLDSPYQISKIIGELYGNYYFARCGLPIVKARFQNVYGPREILGAGQWRGTSATVWRNVVPTFIYKALQREALPIENGGVATRDFIYVDEIVRGLLHCAAFGKEGGVYNLASGVETSIKALAELINELADNAMPPAVAPRRDWDRSGKRFGSTDKAARELHFRAEVSLRDGLTHTIAWTRENIATIRRCMQQHERFLRGLKEPTARA
jgi:nucleoside-diphosphate-sugar epimerase